MADLVCTEHVLTQLELEIPKHHGSLVAACRALSIRPQHLYGWMERDAEVAAAIKAAQQIGYAGIEDAALKRAVDGVEKAVYYQGEVVGYETQYSDALMNTILKARVPGYNPDSNVNHNHTVQVQIMPRANTYEEWLTHAAQAQITHSEDIQDGQYTEVEDTGLKDVL
jgi:hypothetical protein